MKKEPQAINACGPKGESINSYKELLIEVTPYPTQAGHSK